ncbi:type II toxin-antitoxin system VapC family toxin [Pseudonocardia spinosispora]|uniref:type II toxin-antitoxin system VapC family toxin n=1 Tax=Pseudonocardia spinosispora TaxID=103441 RepID=UPI00049091AF|nr:type II toxin-antitoxin system VapC family toxin [Pseudonocardia spinosispora]
MSSPGTLVDSNVLLDIFGNDPQWAKWSAERLESALDEGPVVINQVIYGEVSLRFSTLEALDVQLSEDRFVRANLPWAAAFLAARSYRTYRARGGTRTSPLPDFFIGAHAAVLGLRLLTRDAALYRTYFPTVSVIAP